MLKIQSQLLEGKLVFLFGYGQSGAGKTSTLIYFKDPLKSDAEKGEQGVLVHLCNLFGKGTYKTTPDVQPVTKYTKLKLITQEFYSSDNGDVGKCDGVAKNNDKCKEQTFDFTFEDTLDSITNNLLAKWDTIQNFQNRLDDTFIDYKII